MPGVKVEESIDEEATEAVSPVVSDDNQGGAEDASEASDEPEEASGSHFAELQVQLFL